MDERERRYWILERLKHSLQHLAIPAPRQVALFPDFVVKTDELVLAFDHWRLCAVGNYGAEMTAAQKEALAAIDEFTKKPDRVVWEEASLYTHPFWECVRGMAKVALGSFGWPLEEPPSYAHEYVRGGR